MGDRCHCSLILRGIIEVKNIPLLAEALIDIYPDEYMDSDTSSLEEDIRKGENSFLFSEVNYAEMDAKVQGIVEALNLSYTWNNGPGDGYDAADTYYDARTGETARYSLRDGEICLTIEEIDKPGVVEEARLWQAFDSQREFMVVESNHDLISLPRKKDAPEGYAELLPLIDLSEVS